MAGMATQRLCSALSRAHCANVVLPLAARRSPVISIHGQFRSLATSSFVLNKKLDISRSGGSSGQSQSVIQEIVESESARKKAITPAEKVVEAGKDAGYSMIAILGFGIVAIAGGGLIYNEFGGSQPAAIYRRSLRIVRKDTEVQKLVGSPFKAYGYSGNTARGYRSNVYSVDYLMGAYDDVHRQVKYNIQGKHRKAVVTVDMKEKKKGSGSFDYYTITVNAPGMPPLIVLDNRYADISLTSYQSMDADGPPAPKS